jgi:hypothetical protein
LAVRTMRRALPNLLLEEFHGKQLIRAHQRHPADYLRLGQVCCCSFPFHGATLMITQWFVKQYLQLFSLGFLALCVSNVPSNVGSDRQQYQIQQQMSDPLVIGLAVAGWLATTWLAYKWGQRSQVEQRHAAAHSTFRSVLLELHARASNRSLRVTWLHQTAGEREAAIIEVKTRLSGSRLRHFKDANKTYHQCCNPPFDPTPDANRVGPGPAQGGGYWAHDGSYERALADTFSARQSQELMQAIDALLAFADKIWGGTYDLEKRTSLFLGGRLPWRNLGEGVRQAKIRVSRCERCGRVSFQYPNRRNLALGRKELDASARRTIRNKMNAPEEEPTEQELDTRITAALGKVEQHARGETSTQKDAVPVSISKFSHLLHLLAQKADLATKRNLEISARLLFLTWVLVFLTVALLAFAAIDTAIMLKENPSQQPENPQTSEHH